MFGGESFGWMALKVARGLFAYVTKIIYELIAWVYELLFTVSKIRLLNRSFCLSSDGVNYIKEVGGTSLSSVSDDRARLLCEGVSGVWTKSPITAIYQRVTLLLAIIMVFYVTFQFIKYLITPEEISDKEKGVEKLGFKLITVVALLAVVPTLFDKAYELQDRALNTHFLAKLVLGVTPSEEPDENGVVVPYDRRFGRSFAADILEGFYYFDPIYSGKYAGLDPSSYESKDELCENMPCNLLVYLTTKRLRTVGSLDYINYGLDDYGTVADGVNVFYIHYDWILGNVIGAIVLWMLISYAIDVGIRVIQLTFLQIIAPIPIISFLSPNKDGSFQRWVKQSLLTYLDLFIRLAVIYFTMLVIDIITKSYKTGILLPDDLSADGTLDTYVYIILIIALMMFCKRLAKLLQELFPGMANSLGSLNLKKPSEIFPKQAVSAAKRTFGGAVGGVAGLAVGAFHGTAQGIRKYRSVDKNKALAGGAGGLYGLVRGSAGGVLRGVTVGAKKGNPIKNISSAVSKQYASNKRFGDLEEAGYTIGKRIRDKVGAATFGDRADRANKKIDINKAYIGELDAEIKHKKTEMDNAFEDAVVNGKGKGNAKIDKAVTEYNRLNQLEKDLTDTDSELVKKKKKDTISKITKDDIDNFKKKYEKEKPNEPKLTDEEARNRIADEEIAKEVTEVRNAKDAAKKQVSYAYLDWAKTETVKGSGNYNDGKYVIEDQISEQRNELYNKEHRSNQINRDESIYNYVIDKYAEQNNNQKISKEDVIAAFNNGSISRSEIEDEWIKKKVVSVDGLKTQAETANRYLEAELEKIKRETSSNGGGKK